MREEGGLWIGRNLWIRYDSRVSGWRTEELRVGEERDRDVEKVYSVSEFVAKLRRLADALEAGERFEIQVAGERIYVPARAEFNIEHEREGNGEEIEFQLKWTNG
jgi:amphi-Trp domain-containing protein